ncbi:MAG: DUF2705 family protein [Lachnospiraceae bacterium]|nr:DUF2705 family protein [Lachnospiraceae bacterium]
MRFIRLCCYDLRQGFYKNLGRYLFCGILFAAFTLLFFREIERNYLSGVTRSCVDYLIFLTRGVIEYNPESGTGFEIPLIWFLQNIMLSLLVSNYVTEDLEKFGIQLMIRMRRKHAWWFSKCVWLFSTVFAFHMIKIIFALGSGTISIQANADFNERLYGLDVRGMSRFDLLLFLWILPFLTSLTLALFQMYLSLVLSAIYAFILMIGYLVVSAFYLHPLLIGNNTMLLRSAFVYTGGIDVKKAVVITMVLSLLVIIFGYIKTKRYDILERGDV